MSKEMETAQSYWDARSELFANYYQKPTFFDNVFRKAVYLRVAIAVKACSEIPNATVLDVGSGPGLNSISLIKNANAAHVTGIDFADQMINYAIDLAKEENVADKCDFILGDIMTHNFDKKFDFSLALGVFDYVEDAQKLINIMSDLTTKAFSVSWPEDGLRMRLRRYRYTCPVYCYDLDTIRDLHQNAGISSGKLEIVKMPGGWSTIAKK